ncbi:MAG: glycosyltransferase family 2 protein [Candidatus Krumholzibacteriota bacterium]|nr:glycosyltransferase family 2 protein [Candidatus Krumholzibacteriota bacterium]
MPVSDADLTIIVPALNEEAVVGEVVRGLIAEFPEARVIVVDDGSTDRTGERAKEAGASVYRHDRKLGYGAALKTGIRNSSSEFVLFCDGDGQHEPSDARRLFSEAHDQDMVVGERRSGSHSPFSRRPGKLILRLFADFLAGVKIPDLNSGLRVFRRDIIMKYLHLMPQGFSFSTTSTFAMLKSQRRIRFVPITVRKRVGKSTVRQWRHGPATLMLMLRLTVLFEPLKVFLSVSLALFVISLGSLTIDLTMGGGGVGDTTALMAVSSLIIFMFGLLCDQVSALRREKHD